MTDQDIAGLIRLRQLRELHRILPQTLVANGVLSCAITAWFANDHLRLVGGWLTLVSLVTAFALHHSHKFKRREPRSVSARTIRRYGLYVAAMAVTVIGVPAWLLLRTSGLDFTVLICLLSGVSWCGALTLAAVPSASAAVIAVSHGLITAFLLVAATLSRHPGAGALTSDGRVADHLLLAAFLLGGGAMALRCVRVQARSFLVSQHQSIELEHRGETIKLLLKDFEDQTSDWLWEVDADLR